MFYQITQILLISKKHFYNNYQKVLQCSICVFRKTIECVISIESAVPNPQKRTLSLLHGIPASPWMQQHFPDIDSTLLWVKDILEIQQIGASALKKSFVTRVSFKPHHFAVFWKHTTTGKILILSKIQLNWQHSIMPLNPYLACYKML